MALREAVLQGYLLRRRLPPGYPRLVEAGFIITRMSAYAFALPDPAQQDWLRRRIPEVVQTICRRFLHGESFLLEYR